MKMMAIRAFQIDFSEASYSLKEWFRLSMLAFKRQAPSLDLADYDYVQLIPLKSYRAYFSGNDGAQGFRHKVTGWTIPDYCRQSDGYPEIWSKTHARQLDISEESPIWRYLIVH